jgi:hypothetical protein
MLKTLLPEWVFLCFFKFLHWVLKVVLVVACKVGTDAEPVVLNTHQISFLVYSDPASTPWLVTCAHAPSAGIDRSSFWSLLESTGDRFRGPWILIGDFNAILSSAEKKGGRNFGSPSHNFFVDFVHSNGLVDLGYSGNPFTWNNNRQGLHNIKERLDRGLSIKIGSFSSPMPRLCICQL